MYIEDCSLKKVIYLNKNTVHKGYQCSLTKNNIV